MTIPPPHLFARHTSIDDGSPPTEGISITSDDSSSFATEAAVATTEESDCKTAIERSPVHSVPTLMCIALRVIKDVMAVLIANGTLHLQLPRLLHAVLESGERALITRRNQDLHAVMQSIILMLQVPSLLSDTQRDDIDSYLTKVMINYLPQNVERIDDGFTVVFKSFAQYSKKVLSIHYDGMMPILLSVVRQTRSQSLRIAAYDAIIRLRESTGVRSFSTAIGEFALLTPIYSAPSLKILAIRAVKVFVSNNRKRLAELTQSRIYRALMKCGKAAVAYDRIDEISAIIDCVVWMRREKVPFSPGQKLKIVSFFLKFRKAMFAHDRIIEIRTVVDCFASMLRERNRINDSQKLQILSFFIKARAEMLPTAEERFESSVICQLQSLRRMSKEVLSKHYAALLPMLLSILRQKTTEEMKCAAYKAIALFGDSVRMKKFSRDFVEAFACFVDGNIKHIMSNQDTDDCIGCVDKKANVTIRKKCDSNDCSLCRCPPVWCLECLARSFLRSAPSVDLEAVCPTCRASFCVKDVAIVLVEQSEDS